MFTNFFAVNSNKRRKKKAVDTNGFVQLVANGSFFRDLDEAYRKSPTATMARLKFIEFCVPANLKDEYQKLWKRISNDYIDYGYFLLHQSYDVDGNKTDVTYLSPKKYLVKDLDDNDNASTFINTINGTVFPTFNDNKTVVKAQINDKGYPNFKGQIYMYNDTSNPYRLTPLVSVIDWMKTEANASTYVDKACENAMFGNNIFIVKKSSDSSVKELEILENIKETIRSVKGVEETAQNLLIEYSGDIEDVTKLLTKVSISNEVDVELLNATDEKASEKICLACYGFPLILVKQSEGVFGNSGEAIRVATEEWAKTCQKEAVNILDGFKDIGFNILKEENETISNTDITGA